MKGNGNLVNSLTSFATITNISLKHFNINRTKLVLKSRIN